MEYFLIGAVIVGVAAIIMGCFLLSVFALCIGGIIVFVMLNDNKKKITSLANSGMIASARKRRQMLHDASRKAMEDFNQGVK